MHASHFPDSVSGYTIVTVLALAYSPTILRYVKSRYLGRGGLKVTVAESDLQNTTIHYVKKDRKNGQSIYFIKDLASIYWLKETLEENNLLLTVKAKGSEDHALYLTQERFDKLSNICAFLEVRLALRA